MEAADLPAKQKIAAELQKQAFEDVPYAPLGQYFQPTAFSRKLTGVLPSFPTFLERQARLEPDPIRLGQPDR